MDFDETLNQFNHTRMMLAQSPFNKSVATHSNVRQKLESALKDYEHVFSRLGKMKWGNVPDEAVQEKIRYL